ncbi:MAG TPA: hypothetical protein VNZ53_16095 [Steroidobacteraceae bacterium]|nr:hypothetical protein [Steroidobacteraceae bacterium]
MAIFLIGPIASDAFAENLPGTEWLKTLPLGPEDTEKLLNGNARRLLKL